MHDHGNVSRRHLVGTGCTAGLALLLLLSGPGHVGAAPAPDGCEATKLAVAGKHAASLLKCHAKAAVRGEIVDPLCLAKADAKLEAKFTRAEDIADKLCLHCPAIGDAESTTDQIHQYVAEVVAMLRPVPDRSRCAAKKLKATGKNTRTRLKAEAHHVKRPDTDKLTARRVKASAKLVKQFEAAEGSTCLTRGDVAVVETLGDAVVASTTAEPCPADSCGDGTCNGADTCETCPTDCGSCENLEPVVWAAVWDEVARIPGHRLLKLDSDGQLLLSVRPGRQMNSIAADPTDGTVWISQFARFKCPDDFIDYVAQLSPSGCELQRIENLRAGTLALDPVRRALWASDYYFTVPGQKPTVVRLDLAGNELARTPPISAPRSIALDPATGGVWVADGASSPTPALLRKVRADGTIERNIPIDGHFVSNPPRQIAIDTRDDSAWFTSAGGSDTNGDATLVTAAGDEVLSVSGFAPVSVVHTLAPDGPWIADRTDYVAKLDQAGNELFRVTGLDRPLVLAANQADGTVWVGTHAELAKLGPNGARLATFVLAPPQFVVDISLGSG